MRASIDPPGLTRRGLLQGVAAAAIGAAVGAFDYGAVYASRRLERLEVDLPVVGLPPALAGLRIGLITDIHHSRIVDAALVSAAVDLLRQAAPDIVVLGGDYVTFGDRRFIGPVAELLKPLAGAREGAFAVLGNHDDDRDVPQALAAQGFTVLKDARTAITVRAERLDVAGIRFWTRRPDHIARVLRGAGPTTLLLAHDPRRLREAAELDVQLVLAGHTHGGQVTLPVVGAVAARRFPVVAGTGRQGNTTMYVSRGVGTVYVPVRLNCPPDVSVLTLRSTARL
jgi:predicted MPP superfamily phosphohydrolase